MTTPQQQAVACASRAGEKAQTETLRIRLSQERYHVPTVRSQRNAHAVPLVIQGARSATNSSGCAP